MSDNVRRYCAILDEIRQWCPATLSARQARHLTTTATLISSIVGAQHTHLV